jgi:murein DD-endopeptidase MepM/ murein hydrolase activator NlpD
MGGSSTYAGASKQTELRLRIVFATTLRIAVERFFPERRVYFSTARGMRHVYLKTQTQLGACFGLTLLLSWTLISTSLVFVNQLGTDDFRQQAAQDAEIYQQNLTTLAADRDAKTILANRSQDTFRRALQHAVQLQEQLLQAELHRQEMQSSLTLLQNKLAAAAKAAQSTVAMQVSTTPTIQHPASVVHSQAAVERLVAILEDTTAERDHIAGQAQKILGQSENLQLELQLTAEKNQQIFRQLEDALTISAQPLDKMLGLKTETLLDHVRRGYSGLGGPGTPLLFSTKSAPPDADTLRMQQILQQMDELNQYRIAAQSVPFAIPINRSFRRTSGFGRRWGRAHNGMDFAAPKGTPINTTADGTVTFAGWEGSYGRLVKIRHAFGLETRYAHLSKIRVKKGQRVSRGDRIGDMGSSGRSTGTHLHYEVREQGKAVNPMRYIKAAKNVF